MAAKMIQSLTLLLVHCLMYLGIVVGGSALVFVLLCISLCLSILVNTRMKMIVALL